MLSLSKVFDVFSRRSEAAAKPNHEVPITTRSRILLWWESVVGDACGVSSSHMWVMFWAEIHGVIQLRRGTPRLHASRFTSRIEDARRYLLNCPGEEFLDFLEDVFRTRFFSEMRIDRSQSVSQVNELLRVDELPYHLTDFVIQTSEFELHGRMVPCVGIGVYPMVIMRESEIMHVNAIQPALQLLQNAAFGNANKELLAALEDYRKGDYGDCLTKCGSSFESVMKVICAKKGWPHKETDVANVLVKTVLGKTNLESYFEPLLMIVATLRNRLSSAHGAGIAEKKVSRHLARFAINATTSAMILLADEADL